MNYCLLTSLITSFIMYIFFKGAVLPLGINLDSFLLGFTCFLLSSFCYSEILKPSINLVSSYNPVKVNGVKTYLLKELVKIAFFVFLKVLVLLITGLLFFRHFNEASISFVSGLVFGLILFVLFTILSKNPMKQQA